MHPIVIVMIKNAPLAMMIHHTQSFNPKAPLNVFFWSMLLSSSGFSRDGDVVGVGVDGVSVGESVLGLGRGVFGVFETGSGVVVEGFAFVVTGAVVGSVGSSVVTGVSVVGGSVAS